MNLSSLIFHLFERAPNKKNLRYDYANILYTWFDQSEIRLDLNLRAIWIRH